MIILTDAAKYYNELDHQDIAWDWLQDQIGIETLAKFAEMYRNGPTVEAGPEVPQEYVNKQQLAGIWNCAESLIFEMRKFLNLIDAYKNTILLILFVLGISFPKRHTKVVAASGRKN